MDMKIVLKRMKIFFFPWDIYGSVLKTQKPVHQNVFELLSGKEHINM